MTRSIMTAKSELRIAVAHAKIAKAIIKAHVEAARLMIDEESIHELQDTALVLGSDVGIIESYLSMFSRISFSAKKFAITKKVAVEN